MRFRPLGPEPTSRLARIALLGSCLHLILAGPPARAQRARPAPAPRPPAQSQPASQDPDRAEAAAEPSANLDQPSPTTPERPRLFGDPSKFTRLGGWGGMGGAMGQFGFARSMLVGLPAVQKDLDLTDDQKDRLKRWSEVMRDRGQELTRGMREQAERNMRQDAFSFDALGMLSSMQGLLRENEAGFSPILTPAQRERLDQIALQMEGVTALARPEVAQAVRLHDPQIERIQRILAQARTRQVFHWMGQARQMWAERAPERPPGSPATPERKPEAPAQPTDEKSNPQPPPAEKAPSSVSDDEDVAERRATVERRVAQEKRMREMRQRFENMRAGSDSIQSDTVEQILSVLTSKQRARFESLLGEPFDPDGLLEGLQPPTRRGPGQSGPTQDREAPRAPG